MSGDGFTDPNIARLGLRTNRGPIPERSIFPARALRGAERPLVAQFPGLFSLVASVRNIPLAAPTIATGSSAWYGLGSWSSSEFGDQAVWCGYRVELGATNPTPAADADYTTAGNLASWGSTAGTGAAVVLGVNLPCSVGAWSSGPANVPYVEPSVGATQFAGDSRFFFAFPPGKLEDAPTPAVYRSSQTSPLAVLLTPGMRVDAALVVKKSSVHTVTKSDGILARIFVELTLGKFYTNAEFVD